MSTRTCTVLHFTIFPFQARGAFCMSTSTFSIFLQVLRTLIHPGAPTPDASRSFSPFLPCATSAHPDAVIGTTRNKQLGQSLPYTSCDLNATNGMLPSTTARTTSFKRTSSATLFSKILCTQTPFASWSSLKHKISHIKIIFSPFIKRLLVPYIFVHRVDSKALCETPRLLQHIVQNEFSATFCACCFCCCCCCCLFYIRTRSVGKNKSHATLPCETSDEPSGIPATTLV